MDKKDEKAIEVLQSRYALVRNEVLMRLDYRYKLFQLSLVIVPLFASMILKFEWYYAGFAVSIYYLIILGILVSEALQLVFLSNYLSEIDQYLDETLQLPCKGWEIFCRYNSNSNKKGTNYLAISFGSLFIVSYFLGISIGLYGMYKNNITNIYIVGVSIFSILPIFLIGIVGYSLQKRYWTKLKKK